MFMRGIYKRHANQSDRAPHRCRQFAVDMSSDLSRGNGLWGSGTVLQAVWSLWVVTNPTGGRATTLNRSHGLHWWVRKWHSTITLCCRLSAVSCIVPDISVHGIHLLSTPT